MTVIILSLEAVTASETSVNIYETTRCNIPEDSHFHTIITQLFPRSGNLQHTSEIYIASSSC
jgi:hypothetical protein